MTTNNVHFTFENSLPVVRHDELLRHGYDTTTYFDLITHERTSAKPLLARRIFGLWADFHGFNIPPTKDASDLIYDPNLWEKR